MSLINEETPIIPHPHLELFTQPPVQTSIEKKKSNEHKPIAQLNSGSNYEFKVKTHKNQFTSLDKLYLKVDFRVKLHKTDGTDLTLADWDKVSMVNNTFHSLWSQVDVFFGDTPATPSLQTYPYKAYMQSLFEVSKRQMETSKAFSWFMEDTLNVSEKDALSTVRSDKLKPSTSPFNTSKLISLHDYLYVDPFSIPLNLLGQMELTVRLIPSRPEFVFMTKADAKISPTIEFENITLFVDEERVNANVAAGIENVLQNTNAKYPYKLRPVRTFTIDSGVTEKNLDNMIIGTMPQRLFIAFCSNQAASGNLTKNPFYFGHFNIDQIQCYIKGEPVRVKPYQPDFTNNRYSEEYLEFLRISGNDNKCAATIVTPTKWANGHTIFAFDTTPDNTLGVFETGYLNVREDGHLRISIRFKSALDETINCVLFTESDSQFQIDALRNLYIENA